MRQKEEMECQRVNHQIGLAPTLICEEIGSQEEHMSMLSQPQVGVGEQSPFVMMQEVITTAQEALKIEVRTLTIQEEIIMTIRINAIEAKNLCKNNNLINFPESVCSNEIVSGVGFYLKPYNHQNFGALINEVSILVVNGNEWSVPWFLISNKTWQPKSKVVLHYGLWRLIEKYEFKIPSNSLKTEELRVDNDRGNECKFYGGFDANSFDFFNLKESFFERFCFYVVFLPNNIVIDDFLKKKWTGELLMDWKFLRSVVSLGCLILGRVGGFGDDVGVVLLGGEENLKKLMPKLRKGIAIN